MRRNIKGTKNILAQIFIFNLTNSPDDDDRIGYLYYHLFALQPIDELNKELEYVMSLSEGKDPYFKKTGIEDWFYIWHKSVRQCDHFNGCYQKRKVELITPEEEKEFRFLLHKVKADGYDKRGTDKLFTADYQRYLDLVSKIRREVEDENISGHMDALLWNLVHVDSKEFLVKTFKITFAEYRINYLDDHKPKKKKNEKKHEAV